MRGVGALLLLVAIAGCYAGAGPIAGWSFKRGGPVVGWEAAAGLYFVNVAGGQAFHRTPREGWRITSWGGGELAFPVLAEDGDELVMLRMTSSTCTT